jgi:hypothetical protein
MTISRANGIALCRGFGAETTEFGPSRSTGLDDGQWSGCHIVLGSGACYSRVV